MCIYTDYVGLNQVSEAGEFKYRNFCTFLVYEVFLREEKPARAQKNLESSKLKLYVNCLFALWKRICSSLCDPEENSSATT